MTPDQGPLEPFDELARRRQERAEDPERPLRERVREEARRSARRHAAASRARQRTAPPPASPFGGDGPGAA
jgi:hypothetical protein